MLINRNHNHAEEKDGLWIHHKGATHAETGMLGVIPGNMRDGSFIVVGKGNAEALWPSSHGAGRLMGRKATKRNLKLKWVWPIIRMMQWTKTSREHSGVSRKRLRVEARTTMPMSAGSTSSSQVK